MLHDGPYRWTDGTSQPREILLTDCIQVLRYSTTTAQLSNTVLASQAVQDDPDFFFKRILFVGGLPLERALKASDRDQVYVVHKQRLLTDNGSCYSLDLRSLWTKNSDDGHTRQHPKTTAERIRDKIAASKRILAENGSYPSDSFDICDRFGAW